MNGLFFGLEVPAYIDGGAGSMLLQMALAGVFASLYALKGFWYRIKGVAKVRPNHPDVNSGQ